jgi:DNA-binding GntR family transcriptional regulator
MAQEASTDISPRRAPRGAPAGEAKAPTAGDVMVFLKDRLRRGELVPGQRLVEPDVMRETGASRGRVREALLRLSSEGLVELQEFRGATVKRMTRAEAKQIYEVREMLEGLAARLAATAGLGKEARRELSSLQRELDAAVADYAVPSFISVNERYHDFIVRHSGNDWLSHSLERLRIPLFRLQFQSFYTPAIMKRSNNDHQVITDAILAGDGRRAETAMRSHVRSGLSTLDHFNDSFFA